MNNTPIEEYNKRIEKYSITSAALSRQSRICRFLRIFLFLTGILSSIILETNRLQGAFLLNILLFVTAFIVVVIIHGRVDKKNEYIKILMDINRKSVKRFTNEWTNFTDTGKEFALETHEYAIDLDIAGNDSLFQFINSTETFYGRKRFLDSLLMPCLNQEVIEGKQEAVRELAANIDWRQNFQAKAALHGGTKNECKGLLDWAQKEDYVFNHNIIIFIRLLPVITIITGILSFLFAVLPSIVPVILLFLQTGIYLYFRKPIFEAIISCEKIAPDIRIYSQMLMFFESNPFTSKYLNMLKDKLKDDRLIPAHSQLLRLASIAQWTGYRQNMFYPLFNLVTLWDLQTTISLEKARRGFGKKIKQWIDVLAEVESTACFSIIAFNQPDWAFPVFTEKGDKIEAVSIGHPLIPVNKRITNDLSINGKGCVLIVTGSNMSGKSTLLRTAGINLILAYNGAPVCARSFCCPLLRVFSVMRTKDDLEKGVSSFYAELLKIKKILDHAKQNPSILFLLDEIFKGTNSIDRHHGAKVLIKLLSKTGAAGIVSTHDLALGELAKENDKISNWHFKEYYTDNILEFDYKLYPGISPSRNALYLMKMIGIDIEDNQ